MSFSGIGYNCTKADIESKTRDFQTNTEADSRAIDEELHDSD